MSDPTPLTDVVERWSLQRPDHPAIIFGDETLTYKALQARVIAAANLIADRGVRRGDRVALLADNGPEFIEVLLGCWSMGAVLVPLNTRLTTAEHRFQLDDCEPALLVAGPGKGDALTQAAPGIELLTLDEPLDRPGSNRSGAGGDEPGGEQSSPGGSSLDDPALLVYTSGTTGVPKGAVHTHRSLHYTFENGVAAQDLSAADVAVAVLPLFHVGGLNIQVLPMLKVGGTVVLLPRFDPLATLDAIETHRATTSLLVPTTLQALFEHGRWPDADLSSLRGVMTGSSVVPEHLLQRLIDAGVPAGQIYGSTETGPTSIALPFHEADRVGFCGRAAIHAQARVGDDGEILLKGPHLFTEYWRNPSATAEAFVDGWYRTGDIGHTVDGWFRIDDRLVEMIISGGENIYPSEVEGVLATAPGVAEIAIVARPDDRWGEVPVAVVVVEPGATLDLDSLRGHGQERLARFKLPVDLVVMDALPRTALGKVQKFALAPAVHRGTA